MSLDHIPEEPTGPRYALIVLQTDETLEGDMRRLLPPDARVHVTRIAMERDVSPDTLAAMGPNIAAAAALLPSGPYDAVGYGCTSGTAVIGRAAVASAVREGCDAGRVTDPLSALVDTCKAHGITRLGVVSPYVAAVNDQLVAALARENIDVAHLDTFDVADDVDVVRIDGASLESAARAMAARDVEAVFLSCTNLRTLDVIERLGDLNLPVWSSNLLIARSLMQPEGMRPMAH